MKFPTRMALGVGILCLAGCSNATTPVGGDGPSLFDDSQVFKDSRPWDQGRPERPPTDAWTEAKPLDAAGDAKGDAEAGPLDLALVDSVPDAPQPDLVQPDLLKPDKTPPDLGPPPNDTCQNATILTLTAGKATEKGNTSTLKNEFSTLKCGGMVAFAGPQAYYMVYLDGGQTYKVTLAPSFEAYFYLFSPAAFCQKASIEKDCSSMGSTGDVSSVIKSGASQSLLFTAPKGGYYYIAVDSMGSGYSGAFQLDIELDCSAFNDKCNTGVNVAGKCQAQPKTGTCDDEDPCTQNDICVTSSGQGVCQGTAKVCPGNSCNSGKCDKTSGLCVMVPVSGTCDDGDKCTENDACQNGVCKGTAKDCSASTDTCNNGLCNSSDGLCIQVPKSGTIYCNDNDKCTDTDMCVGGVCKGTQKTCPGDSCNTGSCDATTGYCLKTYLAGTCTDNDLCTTNDTCQKDSSGQGVCKGTYKTCTGDQCNTGSCDPTTGTCVKTYQAGLCNDGDLCSTSDTCIKLSSGEGSCKGTAKTCAGDQCNTGSCDTATGNCVKTYQAGFCSDGDDCTMTDTCEKDSAGVGVCKGTQKTCPGDSCNTGSCDKSSGNCIKTYKAGTCSDSDNCTTSDTCQQQTNGEGTCKGTPKTCPSDTCNTGYCDSATGNCMTTFKAGSCSDGLNCTFNDACVNVGGTGTCQGTTKTCPGDPCNTGYCDTTNGNCLKTYKSGTCSDSDNCTENDTCVNIAGTGTCKGTAKVCAGDSCNTGYCDATSGNCLKTFKAGSCSDGLNCTMNDACVNVSGLGTCQGTQKTCPGDQCNTGYCETSSGNCLLAYKAATCTDGDLCTTFDTCQSVSGIGVCKGTTTVCAGDQCNTGSCDSSTGNCLKTYKAGACSDGNTCTSSDTCVNQSGLGVCQAGTWPLDSWESNNTCSAAKTMGSVAEGSWLGAGGSVSPPTDYDYYYAKGLEGYHACVPWTSQTYYVKAKVAVPSGRTYQLCIYRDSCSGSSSCVSGSGTLTAYVKVSGTCSYNDDTTAYMMVRATDGKQECQGYTLYFGFDDNLSF